MKIITILGTRPELIKLSPLLPLLDQEFQNIIIHTGQHYSRELNEIFIEELQLRQANYHLNIGSGNHGEQTGKMIQEIEKIILQEKPDAVLIFGDTNSTLAGAIAATKHTKVIHLEAGCRSHNRTQPEEINRIVADHCSDILLTIDDESTQNLLKEGFNTAQIHQAGNLLEEACIRAKQTSQKFLFDNLNITPQKYIVATIHREENTNNIENLKNIITALNILSEQIDIVFSLHPRTKNALEKANLTISKKIKCITPPSYIPFINLLSNARFIITDSGGIYQEAVFLNIPILVPRTNIEINEYVQMGKIKLVGQQQDNIIHHATLLIKDENQLQKIKNIPFHFQKDISQNIIKIIKEKIKQEK